MRLSLVCDALQRLGGAQRAITLLANYWADQGATVNLILLDDGPDQTPYYRLAPQVRLSRLDLAHESSGRVDAALANLHRVRRLRRELRKTNPQVVISFLPEANVVATLAAQGIGAKVVISERSIFETPLRPPWPMLRKIVYPLADVIVFQTDRARQAFPSAVRAKGVILPNPVIIPPEPTAALEAPVVIAAGRLDYPKGFDLLLEAFALVASQYPTWSLAIWGDGSERRRLESLRETLGLDGRVRMPGISPEPEAWTRSSSSIFVLPSRWEGFPNALCEAMATGHAVVAADCRFGPREIVTDGEDGLLVPADDPGALAQALGRLMGDAQLRQQLAVAARQSIRRFAIDDVMSAWTELARSLMRPQ